MPKKNTEVEEILESVILDTEEPCDDCLSKKLQAIKEALDAISANISATIVLYQEFGNNTDGAISQAVVTSKINELIEAINSKQDELVSTVNIKSINGMSIVGEGNLIVGGGGGGGAVNDVLLDGTSVVDVNGIARLNGLATQIWVGQQLINYATKEWVDDQNFTTEDWVLAQNYITDATNSLENYYTKDEIDEMIGGSVDIVPISDEYINSLT